MARSLRRFTKPPRLNRGKIASDVFSRQFIVSTRPMRLRSSGRKPIPDASAPVTEPSGISWPRTKTRHVAAASADQTGQPEDFPGAQRKAHVAEPAGRRKILDAQRFLARRPLQMLRGVLLQFAPH